MSMSYSLGQNSDNIEGMIASYEEAHPGFLEELELLNITIDEYDRMLSESEPRVATTDNTIG